MKNNSIAMKISLLCSLLAFGVASSAVAGSFGGPPPFTNLSPLESGNDGSYQAIARGTNLTGIIRFAYQNGVQSPIAAANTYVFFVNGVVTTGSSTVAINGKELAGILGGQEFTVPTNDEGTVELPALFVIRGNRASGSFSGKMDLEDRMSYFSGNGQIIGAGEEIVTFISIIDTTENISIDPPDPITDIAVVIPGSEGLTTPGTNIPALIPGSKFKFEGVRTSFTAQGGFTQPSAAPTPTPAPTTSGN
jgi:hypothetical protein